MRLIRVNITLQLSRPGRVTGRYFVLMAASIYALPVSAEDGMRGITQDWEPEQDRRAELGAPL